MKWGHLSQFSKGLFKKELKVASIVHYGQNFYCCAVLNKFSAEQASFDRADFETGLGDCIAEWEPYKLFIAIDQLLGPVPRRFSVLY